MTLKVETFGGSCLTIVVCRFKIKYSPYMTTPDFDLFFKSSSVTYFFIHIFIFCSF